MRRRRARILQRSPTFQDAAGDIPLPAAQQAAPEAGFLGAAADRPQVPLRATRATTFRAAWPNGGPRSAEKMQTKRALSTRPQSRTEPKRGPREETGKGTRPAADRALSRCEGSGTAEPGAAGSVSARLEERAPETVKPDQASPEGELLLLKSDAPSGTKRTVPGKDRHARGRATAPTAPGLGGAAATPQRQPRGARPAASGPAAPALHLQAPRVQDPEEQSCQRTSDSPMKNGFIINV